LAPTDALQQGIGEILESSHVRHGNRLKTGFFAHHCGRRAIAVLAQTLVRSTKMNTYALTG
jgi:hypothetical protein